MQPTEFMRKGKMVGKILTGKVALEERDAEKG
jgi:hypothetical protein